MIDSATRVGSTWLALREPADAAARAVDLLGHLGRALPGSGRGVIHDLGCGTGAMARWLAPLLPGRQRWRAHERDLDLLTIAAAHPPTRAADGAVVTVEPVHSDITRLRAEDFSGATLITASALLDMLTQDELAGLAAACLSARCPMLLTLSVVGRVSITPADPLDLVVGAAFDAHQRRTIHRGRLLGPDAVGFMVEEFGRLGAEVLVRPSPWRLGPSHVDLQTAWFTGWVGAACEQQAELTAEIDDYVRRRLAQASAGELAVIVGHADVLVLP
jgi:hypothetical protein